MTVLLTVALFTGGCTQQEPGWQRLWDAQWSWHQQGMRWVQGVPAAGRSFEAHASGQVLRTEAVNLASEAAVLRIAGPRGEHQWQLRAHDTRALEVVVDKGRYTLTAAPNVVLGSPRLGTPLAAPRLLVFILVDTLRADHVTAELMPNVVDYFATGRRFDDAWANAPWTLPSVASLFTSRPVLDLTTPEGDLIGVPEGLDTWPERLATTGFEGAAIVANYTVQVHNGFGHGFATFGVPDGRGSPDHPDASWVAAEAGEWLARHQGEDAFLYLHLMDPHEPYRSHDGPDLEPPSLAPLANRERDATAAEQALLSRLYAGEARHVDDALVPLLKDLPDHAIVVFTADHGEALGEHSCWGHGLNLYQEGLHVPLLLRGPGVPAGVTTAPVQLMDLAPAILALLGVEAGPTMLGRSVLEGGSTPMVAATFGGGPLRWAFRQGKDKVILRMAQQPGLGVAAHSTMVEARPLPSGAFHLRLDSDPSEMRPLSLGRENDPMLAATIATFAATAGRMVPGLQVMLAGTGPEHLELAVPGKLEIMQAWSPASMTVERHGERLTMSCAQTSPLCAVAARVESQPRSVEIVSSSTAIAEPQHPITDDPPAAPGPGVHIWWNPPRDRVVHGHEETIERLRALGYLQ